LPFTNYIGSNDYNSGAINLNQEVLDLGRVYLDTKSTMHDGVAIIASRKQPLVQRKTKVIFLISLMTDPQEGELPYFTK
jgi:ferric enterobactin receptor